MITKRPYQYTETENIEAGDKVLLDNSDATRNTKSFDATKLALTSTTVNGHVLSSNVTITATDTGAPTISSGTTAPTSTPAKIGDMYVDTVLKQTYVANGTSSSADWIKQNGSYTLATIPIQHETPLDATTYYLGDVVSTLSTVAAVRRLYIPKSGAIRALYGVFRQAAVGNETSSLYIRVNNTTDYLISDSIVNNVELFAFNNTALNIPISAGNYIELKWVTPTWGTNPTIYFVSKILIDL